MKFLSIINYAALAAAAVIYRGEDIVEISGRAISTTLYNELDFYVQWAEAAYCNADVANNTLVACAYDNCDAVEANKATVVTAYTASESSGDETEIALIVGRDDVRKEIVVAYRGSVNIRNWIVNLSFLFSSCDDLVDDCEVHHGFLWAWQETGDVVMQTVAAQKVLHPDYSVVATGHSLGAAIATIATGYLRDAGYPTDLYTYGSPRVGNEAFVEYITNQAGSENRVTKLSDPVPRLPPIFTGYRHTSPELWIDEGDDDDVTYSGADFEVCIGFANTSCNAGELSFDVDAHRNYLQHTGSCTSGNSKRGLEGSAAAAAAVSDADLNKTLTTYFQKDIEYVKSK